MHASCLHTTETSCDSSKLSYTAVRGHQREPFGRPCILGETRAQCAVLLGTML